MDLRCGNFEAVPAIWVSTSASPAAGIVFRAGEADEEPQARGVTALIARLAMDGASAFLDHDLVVRTTTSAWFTSFVATGPATTTNLFFTVLLHQLADPKWDRLEAVAAELTGDLGEQPRSPEMLALSLRDGATAKERCHPPTREHKETIEHADQWRRQVFTQENLALWFTGEQPPMVDCSVLPTGKRMPMPSLPESPKGGRQIFLDEQPGTCVSFIAEHSAAVAPTVAILQQRLQRAAACVEIGVSATRTSDTRCQIAVTAECARPDVSRIYELIKDELARLAYHGPSQAELTWFVDTVRCGHQDDATAPKIAADAAERVLLGCSAQTPAGYVLELEGVGIGDVAALLDRVTERLLIIAPAGTIPDQQPDEVVGGDRGCDQDAPGSAPDARTGSDESESVVADLCGYEELQGEQEITGNQVEARGVIEGIIGGLRPGLDGGGIERVPALAS